MHSTLLVYLFIYFNLDISNGATTGDGTCASTSVTCPCGISGKTVTIQVKHCATLRNSNWLCKPCLTESAICKTFEGCHECRSDITNRCSLCPQARGGMLCDEVLGCQTSMPPANGNVDPFIESAYGAKEGEVVRYFCFSGYSLTAGSVTRMCRKDGTWSGIEPICDNEWPVVKPVNPPKQKCTLPSRVENSRIIVNENSVTYVCDPNFTLVGNSELNCENGEWSSTPPRCESRKESQMCPSVEPIKNAKVELSLKGFLPSTVHKSESESADKFLGPYPEGTQLIYSCESNLYNQMGSRVRTCVNGKWSAQPPICIPVCGQSNKPRTPFIINGTASEIGQWPWAVAIRQIAANEWAFKCGGSLITERIVLTAAHCVTLRGLKTPILKDSFKVYVGKYFLDDTKDDSEVQVQQPRKIFVHPDYNPASLDSDIGLIEVVTSFRLTVRVQPICLPSPVDMRSRTKNVATVIGWGYTENKQTSSVLNNLEVPLVSTEKCRSEYAKKGIRVTENMICAGYDEGGRDACSGDSGGALMFPTDRSDSNWVVEGIVSWGGSLESQCAQAGEYGSYVKVRNYIDWIKQHMFSK
uniref:limulus clotting factor C n=1 Tax=Strigamia maritima TaxID=126957 RepID=T1J4F7_STRMM